MHRFVWSAILIVGGAATPPLIAQADSQSAPAAKLHSPYRGDPQEYTLPLDQQPTLVFLVSRGGTLLPMDLVRGLRIAQSRWPDQVKRVVVFVGPDRPGDATVQTLIEQRNLLSNGLRSSVDFLPLEDRDGAWYAELGSPPVPHTLLLGGDGEILARELFLGPFDWEIKRIESRLGIGHDSETVVDRAVEDDVAKHPFRHLLAAIPLLSERDEARLLPARERIAHRLDTALIVSKLAESDPDQAQIALRAYCESGHNLTLVRRFAEAALARFGTEVASWAQPVVDSQVEGFLSSSLYNLEAMHSVVNRSTTRVMHVSIDTLLRSRWDDREVAKDHQSLLVQPRSEVFLSNEPFQANSSGWGDYLVCTNISITMSEGEWPKSRALPTLKRTWRGVTCYLPRNEYPEEEDLNAPGSLPVAARAFLAALDERIRALTRESQSEAPRPVSPQHALELTRQAVDSLRRFGADLLARADGPARLIGRPFPGLNLGGWIQGREAFPESDGPGLKLPPGKVILLDFMFVECPPCRAALPKLTKLQETYRDRGLVVLSLAASWGAKGMYGLIDRGGFRHSFAVLDKDQEQVFRVTAFPSYVLIDRDGIVRWAAVGGEPDPGIIEPFLAEKP